MPTIEVYRHLPEPTWVSEALAEQWAEALYVSVETVKAWEGDRRIPSNYHVCLMVDLCGDAYFAYKHLQQTSDGLAVLPDTVRQSLPMAVIQLVNRIIGFADRNRDKELLQIADMRQGGCPLGFQRRFFRF